MNLHIQSRIVWEWPPMELRAERGRWVSEIRSNIGRRRAGEVSTIHYAASWSVSKTIYRPLTRGKHWLSRHPHRVTCRRQTKYFSSPLALPRNIVAAACPELGVRYLHPDIVHSHPINSLGTKTHCLDFCGSNRHLRLRWRTLVVAEIVKWSRSRWIDKMFLWRDVTSILLIWYEN